MNKARSNYFDQRGSCFEGHSIKLEFTSYCNARCLFCLMMQSNKGKSTHLTKEDLLNFIELNSSYLRQRRVLIEPFFNGESILHPNFFEFIDLLVTNEIQLGDFHTNLSIKLDIDSFSRIPFNSVTINIGGITKDVHSRVMGTDFDTVIENIIRLSEKSTEPSKVFIKMNPVKDNIHQIDQLETFFQKLGIGFKVRDQKTGLSVPTDYPKDMITYYLDEVFDRRYEQYFRFKVEAVSRTIKEKNPNCVYMIPSIFNDGTLTICSHDQKKHLNMGNAFARPLEELLNNVEYKKNVEKGILRQHYFCRGCN